MSNSVPEGWNFEQLGDYVSDSAAGEWGNEAQGDQNDIPVLRSTNFTESGIIDYTKLAFRNIEEKKRIKKALKKGDILLEKSGGSPAQPVGRVVYFDRDTPHLFSNFTQKLVPVKDCDSKYLFYKLYFEYQNGTVLKFQQQTTGIINFQLAEYLGFKTIFAPLPEQQKIAAILSSVDDVIEKTRAQIGKLKDLKIGMMQELLSKGIGHSEFKDSPVGRIPAPWAVKTVGDLGAVVTGSTPKTASREYYGGSIPFISPSDINHSMYIRKTANSLTEAGLKETRELPAGTVCVVCIGSTIGKTGITTFRCATNQQVNAVICRGTHPEFVYYLLTYHSKVIKAEAGTQAVPIINKSSFSALPVQLPGYDEQVEIGNSIASVDSQTSFLESKLQSTTSLKKALMQDLLTGKVRVKVDQKESAVA